MYNALNKRKGIATDKIRIAYTKSSLINNIAKINNTFNLGYSISIYCKYDDINITIH